MAGNGPNGENRRDEIDQGKKQAAVEGGRRPQGRRCFQPEHHRGKRSAISHRVAPRDCPRQGSRVASRLPPVKECSTVSVPLGESLNTTPRFDAPPTPTIQPGPLYLVLKI